MTVNKRQFFILSLTLFLFIGLVIPVSSQIATMDEQGKVFLNQQLRDIQFRLNYLEDNTFTDSSITSANIVASTITAGTIEAGTISGTNITGSYITGGTITGGAISGGTITGGAISGGTITGGAISGGTITGGAISGGTITGSTISALLGEIGGWYIAATTLADDATPGNANVLLDSGNGLIRVGDSASRYITIDGANEYIRTSDYASGPLGSGWHVGLDIAEFQNIRARGKITTAVFEKDVISSIGGNFLVSDSDILDADMTAADVYALTIVGDTTFAVNDVLRIKDGVDDEWFQVTANSLAPIYGVDRDKGTDYSAGSNPAWTKGTAVVNYGASGEGLVFMTASEANAPHIDVLTHAGAPWTTTTTRMRLGNVNGFLGAASDLYGIYIGESAKYLKYDPTNGLQIKGTVTIEAGSGGYDNLSDKLTDAEVRAQTAWSHASDVTKIDGGDIYANTIVLAGLGSAVTDQMFDSSAKSDNIQAWTHTSDATLIDGGDIYTNSVVVGGLNSGVTDLMFTASSLRNNTQGWAHTNDATYIDGGDIYANTIVLAGLGSAVTDNMFDDSATSDNVQAWKHSGDVTKIDGGDIYTSSISTNSLAAWSITSEKIKVRELTADRIIVDSLTADEIAGAAIHQGELNTTEQEVSLVWSDSTTCSSGGGGGGTLLEQENLLTLSAGLYGLYPQLKSVWAGDVPDYCYDWGEQVRMAGDDGEGGGSKALSETYTTYVQLRLWFYRGATPTIATDIDVTLYAKFKYITSSNETPWLFLLVDKATGKTKASSFAYDPPSVGNEADLQHPFGKYDPATEEVILVDNEIMNKIKNKVKQKHSVLTVINEEYEVDMASSPVFEPVVVNEIDEYDDKPGKKIKKIKVPKWAKIYTGEDEIYIKQRTISALPPEIKYKKVKKK